MYAKYAPVCTENAKLMSPFVRVKGLLENVRYIGGISGSNWYISSALFQTRIVGLTHNLKYRAMWNYVYGNKMDVDDQVLLGPVVDPGTEAHHPGRVPPARLCRDHACAQSNNGPKHHRRYHLRQP